MIGRRTIAWLIAAGLTLASSLAIGQAVLNFNAFTLQGQIPNANIENPQTTVNGTVCTLGSSCTVSTASSITVDATAVSAGTDGRILYDNAGVLGEKIVTGTGNAVLATSPTLVTPTLGIATATSIGIGGVLAGSNAVNAGGQIASTGATTTGPGFYTYLSGDTQARVAVGLDASDNPRLSFGPGGSTARDTHIYRDAANIIGQRSGTSAQGYRVYNTFTDASNGEWATLNWIDAANTLTFGTKKNGSGSSRNINVAVGGTTVGSWTSTGINSAAIGATTPSSGAFTTLGASGVASFTNTTDSSSTTTGGGVFSGGVGVAKKLYVGSQIFVTAGSSAANPDFTWASDPDTGMYHDTQNNITFSTNGAESFRIGSVNNIGIGGAGTISSNLSLNGVPGSANTTTAGVADFITIPPTMTGTRRGFWFFPSTAASSFTNALMLGFSADLSALGAGSTVSAYEGFRQTNISLNSNTTIKGFRGLLSSSNSCSGPCNYNLYMDGSAPNLLAGDTSITSSTASSSSSTGALQVTGGVGVGGAIHGGSAILSSSPSAGVGYEAGAGGTVTQTSSRFSTVTINKISGSITLVSFAGSTTPTTFQVNNTSVSANDVVIVNQKSGADKYEIFVTNITNNSFNITYFTTGGTTTEQPVFNFAIIKGANS